MLLCCQSELLGEKTNLSLIWMNNEEEQVKNLSPTASTTQEMGVDVRRTSGRHAPVLTGASGEKLLVPVVHHSNDL